MIYCTGLELHALSSPTHPGVGNCIRSVVRSDVRYESYILGSQKCIRSDIRYDTVLNLYHTMTSRSVSRCCQKYMIRSDIIPVSDYTAVRPDNSWVCTGTRYALDTTELVKVWPLSWQHNNHTHHF